MIVNSKIFKTYDIRALYPQEINEEVFPDIIKGIYTFFTRRLKKDVLMAGLSHDMRISSPTENNTCNPLSFLCIPNYLRFATLN